LANQWTIVPAEPALGGLWAIGLRAYERTAAAHPGHCAINITEKYPAGRPASGEEEIWEGGGSGALGFRNSEIAKHRESADVRHRVCGCAAAADSRVSARDRKLVS